MNKRVGYSFSDNTKTPSTCDICDKDCDYCIKYLSVDDDSFLDGHKTDDEKGEMENPKGRKSVNTSKLNENIGISAISCVYRYLITFPIMMYELFVVIPLFLIHDVVVSGIEGMIKGMMEKKKKNNNEDKASQARLQNNHKHHKLNNELFSRELEDLGDAITKAIDDFRYGYYRSNHIEGNMK